MVNRWGHTPDDLSWADVEKDVREAITRTGCRVFVKTNYIYEQITSGTGQYPTFQGITRKTALCRITHTMRKRLGWQEHARSGNGSVFIIPEALRA